MIEISVLLFSLFIEGFFILLVILLVWVFLVFRKKKRERRAVGKLVDQLKQQSHTRIEVTGSFLHEKYRFEGDELKKTVKAIDKSEKEFFQKLIKVYLKRDAESLISMDASVAELVDIYKSLSPIMPEAVASEETEEIKQKQVEIENLKESNAKLEEELGITKTTMANMIGEFGNMFGGGSDHELAKDDVIEKVKEHHDEENADAENKETEAVEDIEIDEAPAEEIAKQSPLEKKEASRTQAEVVSDDEVDDLLNSIDLSD